jgi:hypothetical protein
MTNKIVLYGAGRDSYSYMPKLMSEGYSIICFCDTDKRKWGGSHLGLPVMCIEEAIARYGKFNIYVTLSPQYRYEVFEYLASLGIRSEHIVNFEKYTRYIGCTDLETTMVVNEEWIAYCCARHSTPPTVTFDGNAESVVDRFIDRRDELINEIRQNAEGIQCSGCRSISERVYPNEKKIRELSFGLSSPCNCGCIYCNVPGTLNTRIDERRSEKVENFDYKNFIMYLEAQQLIKKNETRITFASGELTIDKRIDDILDAAEPYMLSILSNGIKYHAHVAELLARPGNSCLISLDAGTWETYKRVKRVDAFDRVIENIRRYRKEGANI